MRSALYIHLPWCIKKCPYCDFNSHKKPDSIQELDYIKALILDLQKDLSLSPISSLSSIFLGGGTPSLISPKAYELLFKAIHDTKLIHSDIEITMEANPGTIDSQNFKEYRNLGINRLSLGIQSFNDKHLKLLGRIHDASAAKKAFEIARAANFNNINIDLMYGLPKQNINEALEDLNLALELKPEHLSWYQLTLEPNTEFFKYPPKLPTDDKIYKLEQEAYALLEAKLFERYEISAFCQKDKEAQHNLNYWLFGDYLGIGAGAHGKLTQNTKIIRTQKHRQPKTYMDLENKTTELKALADKDLIFEFMLNTTRLSQKIPYKLFEESTRLSITKLMPLLEKAASLKLVILHEDSWQVSTQGRKFTNNLQEIFLST